MIPHFGRRIAAPAHRGSLDRRLLLVLAAILLALAAVAGAHLYEFPIDIIKIDRSFVGALGIDTRSPDLAKALVELGHTFGLTVASIRPPS